MDSHQWRDQQQSPSPALTFFSPEPITITKHPSSSPLPRMSYFTMAQWQELELQALIYKYMMAGVSVPVELIQPVKRSLLNASACYHHPELFQHLQASFTQTGEWGRSAVDPEPGRCRRTDGKKWRCSREVMVGHKYCERHVHRGRNRSRKPVETPTLTAINNLKASASSPLGLAKEKYLNLSGSLPTLGIFPRSQRHSDVMKAAEERLQSNSSNFQLQELADKKHEGYVLQRFFDEWPKSQQESNDSSYTSRPASALHPNLSSPGYAPSDFSLKLSTGNSDCSNHNKDDPPNNNSWSAWVRRGEASMGGGPLAEALSSSVSTRSPTSVLHKLNGSVSESSSISP